MTEISETGDGEILALFRYTAQPGADTDELGRLVDALSLEPGEQEVAQRVGGDRGGDADGLGVAPTPNPTPPR